jgi:hypothetical protein
MSKREVLPGQVPAIYDGGKIQLHMDRPAVPVPRPSTECPDLVRHPDRAPATLKIAIGPRGVTDGSVESGAATCHLETKQPVAPKTGAVVATTTGSPATARLFIPSSQGGESSG